MSILLHLRATFFDVCVDGEFLRYVLQVHLECARTLPLFFMRVGFGDDFHLSCFGVDLGWFGFFGF